MTSMSYAKYLYTSYYQVDVAEGDHVDHINGDKMDDRIENLQVISGTYNRQKDHKRKEMVVLVCPVCNEEFLFPKGNLSTHPNPCCSRKCGGIKSHWKQWLKGSRFKPWLAYFLGFLNRFRGLTGQCMLIQYNQQFRLRKENKEQLFLCVKGMPWNPPVAVRRVRGSKKVGRVVPSEETAQAEQVFPLSLWGGHFTRKSEAVRNYIAWTVKWRAIWSVLRPLCRGAFGWMIPQGVSLQLLNPRVYVNVVWGDI